ncbi:sugar ABC transporter permease [candidate division KSB1 bacterium]|nr:MAG: sugar ABC transporter permease [candidate division KSB1 bacterium]
MEVESVNTEKKELSINYPVKKRGFWQQVKENLSAYTFLTPMTLAWVAFGLYPMIASYWIVLYEWSGIGEPTRYVGLANFARVISDPFFWKAFRNSFIYAGFQVPIQLFLALVLAMTLNLKWLKGKAVFRTIFFLPSLMSRAIIGLVLGLMLSPFNGVINEWLIHLHIIKQGIDWLGDPRTAFPTVIAVGIWQTLGINMIYFSAGLQAIPNELYEVAALDGSNALQRLFHITLPLIRPVFLIILILALIGSLNVFELVLVLTYGGPYYATEVVQTYIYKFAFAGTEISGGRTEVGFASAAALFMGIMVLALTGLQVLIVTRLRRKRAEYFEM